MTFRKQLIIGQAASVLLTFVTGLIAVVALSFTTRSASSITRELAVDYAVVQQVRLQSEQLVSAARAYLLTGDAPYVNKFARIQDTFARSIERLRARSMASAVDLDELEEHASDYVIAVTRAARMRTSSGDPRAILETFERDLKPLRDAFDEDVDGFVDVQRAAFDQDVRRARERASAIQLALIVATLLGVALSIGLGIVVMRKLGSEFRHVQRAKEEAARASEARKQLLAVVSHDLRSPLSTIILGAAALRDPAPPRQDCVEMIASAAERMQHLIDELVDVARVEGGAIVLAVEQLEVRELLDLTARMFRDQAAAKGIELRVECEVGSVVADRERVLRVLSNLVGNALKFARRGTLLEIVARAIEDRVHVDVIDRGPGISAEDLARLFEHGWRGERNSDRGLGLGLYICKVLVEAHRGTIGVESTLGEGSRFWFELPRRVAHAS